MEITVRNKKNWTGEGFYVGRPSPLSNPFRIEGDQTREIVLHRYGVMLKRAIQKRDAQIITALQNIEAYLIEHGKCNLICYCSPKPCHADLIKQVLLNKFHTDNWLIGKDHRIGVMDL